MTFRCLAAWQGADSLLPPPCPRTRRQVLLLPGHGVPPRGPAHPAPGRNLLHPRPGGGQRLRPAGHERLRAGRALRPVLHDDPRAARQLGAVRRGVRGQGARGHGVALPVHERVQGRLRLAQEQARGAFLRRCLPRPARATARPGGNTPGKRSCAAQAYATPTHPPARPPTGTTQCRRSATGSCRATARARRAAPKSRRTTASTSPSARRATRSTSAGRRGPPTSS